MDSTFSFFSSIVGFVVAVISLLAFIVRICQSHLPSNKIKTLESLLDETESFFKKAVEDGLLAEPEFIRETERHLTILRTRTCVLRSSAYNATTLCKDFIELFNGTSSVIGRTCSSLRTLRAQVITSSEEGRLRLTERDSGSLVSSNTAIPLLNCSLERHATPSPAVEVLRPHSCPPIVSGGNFRVCSVPLLPFHDSVKSVSDV